MFLEILIDTRTGIEKNRKEITKEEIKEKHITNNDILSWVGGGIVGSTFSMTSRGFIYKRLSK